MFLEEISNEVDVIIFYIFCGISGVAFILFLLSMFVIGCGCKRWGFMVAIDQGIFIGGLLLCATVLMKGLKIEWLDGLDRFRDLCQVYPAGLTLGLTYIIGGLLVKAIAILDQFKSAKSSRSPFRGWKPALGIFVLVVIDAVVIIVWSLVFRNTAVAEVVNGESKFRCISNPDHPMAKDAFEWAILAFHAFLLLLAAIMVWPALYKVYSGPAATETKFVTFMVYNIFLACVVPGMVIHFLLWNQRRISVSIYYGVIGGLTLYAVISTMLLVIASQAMVGGARKRRRDRQYDED